MKKVLRKSEEHSLLSKSKTQEGGTNSRLFLIEILFVIYKKQKNIYKLRSICLQLVLFVVSLSAYLRRGLVKYSESLLGCKRMHLSSEGG